MEGILDVVIKVLQTDESQGQISLTSLIDLTSAYGEIWQKVLGKLLYVLSEIMKTLTFEEKTR